MRMCSWALLACAIMVGGVQAEKPTQKTAIELKPLGEVWEAAFVEVNGVNAKIGHVYMNSELVKVGDDQTIRTTKQLRFVINRGANPAEMKSDSICYETPKGDVTKIDAKLWLGKDNILELNCAVQPMNMISVQAAGPFNYKKEFRWDPTCIGLTGEHTFLKNKKAKPGDELTYRTFEPQVTNYVTVKVTVNKLETVTLPGGLSRELLKVTAKPDPLMLANGQKLQLPPATIWADPVSFETVKTQTDLAELGLVTLVRTSKVAALAPNGQVPDLMKRQSIYLAQAIPDMHKREQIVYRITFKGDALPKELIKEDIRQKIIASKGNTFDLEVTAKRTPPKVKSAQLPGAEFLKSNYFINSDDPNVKKLAKNAVGVVADPWQQAQKIEAFVLSFMKPVDYSEAMAPADHVAKTAEGDCTEYAMLTAAMCRAVGIPSRTAIGLVYVNNLLGKPGLAFHMWTEVWINGEWLTLDATLGQGSVGPGHIKITDHSWDGVISFTPLLPVKGFIMANPAIEVIKK